MCKAMEEMRRESLQENMVAIAKRMLADGTLPCEKIAEYVGLTLDEVKRLQEENADL